VIKGNTKCGNGVVLGSYGSLKVTGNSAIRYSVYEFLLAFHNNHFQDIAR